ncbi:MAG: hypothetical protein L3J89_00645 [Gammaproteobacteria bacterium]|nr:hypothetical protein [Gammaproteobacteria bacterium]
MAKFMYVGGLRLMEVVRDGKGSKSRTTCFPKQIHDNFHLYFEQVKSWYEKDLSQGLCNTYLPHALARKYPGTHDMGMAIRLPR